MMQYSLQPKDRILVKGYIFFSFAKNMGKDIGRKITKKFKQKTQSMYISYMSKFSLSC